ncbi:MAG: helix-turn-helix transcriptional regulator [Bacteroidota bacterium]
MAFGDRLNELRKKSKFSQEDLAKMAGVYTNVLGRYERGEAKPSIDVASKLADALGVSLDYLTGKSDLLIDEKGLDKILTIQKLPDSDQEHIMFAIDALLRDAKARAAYS